MSSATTRTRLPFFAIVCSLTLLLLCLASGALALQRISTGEVPGGAEGDPIDSNDFGGSGGGGGNGDDVEDSSAIAPDPGLQILRFGDWIIVIVPDGTLGGSGYTVRIYASAVSAGETRDAQ